MVCTNKGGEKTGGEKLERPAKGWDISQKTGEGPKPIW